MCGLTGFVDFTRSAAAETLTQRAEAMAETLRHRGPDDKGAWVDAEAGIALGFRRLSIIDLSAQGHQPMLSASGRYVIVFNGEVYNFRELKGELESAGIRFKGSSDTEVILEAIEAWGLEAAVRRFIGMFAIALWDRHERTLHLVRDRIGVKPLYWGRRGKLLLFGSELKALRAHPDWTPEIDRGALAAYFRHSYVPSPFSIYKGIEKLMPGSIVSIGPDGRKTTVTYWSLEKVRDAGRADLLDVSDDEAADGLDALIRESVGLRMISDVPLGAFLSGGIDSSTVVAEMQAQSSQPVKTFTIGFEDDAVNEAQDARRIADHLGTDHTELVVRPAEAREVIPRLAEMYDEPFADASHIPTALVSRLARRDVTVSLSGDGGDELFGGYDRYIRGRDLWAALGKIPAPVRPLVGEALRAVPIALWNALFSMTPEKITPGQKGHTMHWLAGNLASGDFNEFFRRLVSTWDDPETLVPGAAEAASPFWAGGGTIDNVLERMMHLDSVTYLPDDILAKLDRASMTFSLEAREPLLDHRLFDFAWRLPERFRFRESQGKWLLKKVLTRYVPPGLWERPKQGFSLPLGDWLRGPLREWAEELLAEKRLAEDGILDPACVGTAWKGLLAGNPASDARIWTVLMFQAWRQRWRS
ncbi:MAG: asparagine synthase (glutamine-hydrolyzing) [Rhodospirillaceae bacterium]|jgi:asparagine synthase (glutamine-hydrolysing)|nr:asparagine synthase (glutamine-hydrolyzing) [Rhodospirillaceae bacterium]